MEEQEWQVGGPVRRRVGSDDREWSLRRAISRGEVGEEPLGHRSSRRDDFDIEVLGSKGDGRHGGGQLGKQRGGVCDIVARRGRTGLAGLDLLDTVLLVGRVDGTDRTLEGLDDVQDIVEFSDLWIVRSRAGQLGLAGRVEVGQPGADGRV